MKAVNSIYFNICKDKLRPRSEAEIANVQIGRDGVYGYKRPESEVQIGRDGVYGYKRPESEVQIERDGVLGV